MFSEDLVNFFGLLQNKDTVHCSQLFGVLYILFSHTYLHVTSVWKLRNCYALLVVTGPLAELSDDGWPVGSSAFGGC